MDSPEAEVSRVAEALRDAIHYRHSSQRKVEQALHHGKGYLSQLLNGDMDLKLKHVFAVLGAIGVGADEFFLDLYEKPDPVGAVHGLMERVRVKHEVEELKNRVAQLEAGAGAETKRLG